MTSSSHVALRKGALATKIQILLYMSKGVIKGNTKQIILL